MLSHTPPFDSDEGLSLIDAQPAASISISSMSSEEKPLSANMDDYTGLTTPDQCLADFCIVPIGTPSASVSREVAAVQRLLKASGLDYSMHSAGTTAEGSWDDVMEAIGKAHNLLHDNGLARVHTDIRVGSRTDKVQHIHDKVAKVESLLAADSNFTTPSTATTASSPLTRTAIQPLATTSQAKGFKGPWLSASMHLKRSFIPLQTAEAVDADKKDNTKWYLWRKTPGHHLMSLEFRTGFEGLQMWHAFYFIVGMFTIGSFFTGSSWRNYGPSPGAAGRGRGLWR